MSLNNESNNTEDNTSDNVYETETETESESSDENVSQTNNLELTCGIIKNYNIICELGRGSFSIVWLAYNITNNNFYALKVQNPSEYEDGLLEIKFVSKLPTKPNVFNNIIEYFIEIKDDNKYLCSVWELHCSNIDDLLRKGNYQNGLPLEQVKSIMKQLIESINILHNKYNVFHGDIKTDNILVKGINDKDKFITERYKEENFIKRYNDEKKAYWLSLGNNLDKIYNLNKKDKINIRKKIHKEIVDKITKEYNDSDISQYSIDPVYLQSINISLADFGTYCEKHNYYDEPFGTRYYQAPEIILMGKCSLPVDIWAIGCTFYELLSGKLLFDPIKDSKYSRDYYHLCLINETCGDFSKKFLKKTKYYKDFFDSKLKIIDYSQPLSNRLTNKVNEMELDDKDKKFVSDILQQCLSIIPDYRASIKDLLLLFS